MYPIFGEIEADRRAFNERSFMLVGVRPSFLSSSGKAMPQDLILPKSFLDFRRQFQCLKVLRDGLSYSLSVASPGEYSSFEDTSDAWVLFGYLNAPMFGFRASGRIVNDEVWQIGVMRNRSTKMTFLEWLETAYHRLKSRHRQRWAEALRGPLPFTDEELRRLGARQHIRWRYLGVEVKREFGNPAFIRFAVRNESGIPLSYITLNFNTNSSEARWMWLELPVAAMTHEVVVTQPWLGPAPQAMSLAPTPDPEFRDLYWEFRGPLSGSR